MEIAVWNGAVLARSDHTQLVEGNRYFPPDSLDRRYLKATQDHSVCPWKGVASYFDVEVDGQRNRDAAWFYPDPTAEAAEIKDHVAFWKGVEVHPE